MTDRYGWNADPEAGQTVWGYSGSYVHRPDCDGHCLDEGECYACYYSEGAEREATDAPDSATDDAIGAERNAK